MANSELSLVRPTRKLGIPASNPPMSPHARRVLKILSWLSAGQRLTTQQILDKLSNEDEDLGECSKRSIQRDLNDIQESGFAVLSERIGNVREYWMERRSHLNMSVGPPPSPVMALHLLKTALPQFRGLNLEGVVSEQLKALHGVDDAEVFSAELIATTSFGDYIGVSQPDPDILDALIMAIVQKEWIKITYRSNKTHKIYPCRLLPYRGRLYLASWTPIHKSFVTFSTDQIRSVKTIVENDVNVPKFSIAAFMKDRFGLWSGPDVQEIVIRGSKEVYQEIVTRKWHPTQQVRDLEDGDFEISFKTGLGHELRSWILHWTPHLHVVRPKALRDEIREMHRVALETLTD